jgi:hypothetical protein
MLNNRFELDFDKTSDLRPVAGCNIFYHRMPETARTFDVCKI